MRIQVQMGDENGKFYYSSGKPSIVQEGLFYAKMRLKLRRIFNENPN